MPAATTRQPPRRPNNGVRLVLVKWLDSRRPVAEWRHLRDLAPPLASACVSVGWLLHDGVKVKAIAPNMADVDSEANMQASGVIEIPTRCIVSIKTLREPR